MNLYVACDANKIRRVIGHNNCEGSAAKALTTRRRRGKRMCQWLLSYFVTSFLILFYYTCSIGLTFYQKHLFKDFKFPLIVVLVHLGIKFILSGLCREIYFLCTGHKRVTLAWNVYVKRLFPPGIAAGLDIGLSQWSLEFISVTLYTMSKSTALLFILFFAVLFKLEEMRWSVVILVFFIAGGLFMFTYEYTEFNLFGFLLVISASVLSGLRWTLSEIVMRKGELGLKNPIDLVYHIQPWMMVTITPLAIVMEGELLGTSEKGFRFHNLSLASMMWLRIVVGAVIAFLMEVSEYLVVCYTSSLTLSIAGVAKEILTLSISVYYYNEHLTFINQIGLSFCVIGIVLHVILKTYYQSSSSSAIAKSPLSSSKGHPLTLNQIMTSPRTSQSKESNSDSVPLLSPSSFETNDEFELFSR